MNLPSFASLALLALATTLPAQTPASSSPQTPAPPAATAPAATAPATKLPRPALQEAPGGGPDKVWVNTNSSTYHCPGDRFYGKTAHGRYMTEPAAKSAGAHGVGGKTCFAAPK